jgi:hypothetical protein
LSSREINYRTYFRAVVALTMMVVWSLVTISGFLLWSVPRGPRSGAQILFLNLTKRDWGELHVWFSFVAILITIMHLVIDWRAFCGCMKYLASTHRLGGPANAQPRGPRPSPRLGK